MALFKLKCTRHTIATVHVLCGKVFTRKAAHMNLRTAIEGFFVSKRAENLSEATLAVYEHYLGLFAQRLGHLDIEAMQPADILAFAAWLRQDYKPRRFSQDDSQLSPSSLANA